MAIPVTDLLGDQGWWCHSVVVERFTGNGSYGDTWAAADTVIGFYSDKTEYSGGEVVAQGRFAFPIGIDYVPVQSRVTLPAEFGTAPDGSPRTYQVVSSAVGNGGGQPTPDHQVIAVK